MRKEEKRVKLRHKEYSFDKLTQLDKNLALSHLSSYIRKSYDNVPAIQQFRSLFGENVLETLHLKVIQPDAIVMDEKLMQGKIVKTME